MYQQCNNQNQAKIWQTICRPNFKGVLCSYINTSGMYNSVERHCLSSNSNCSSECRDTLVSTRNKLGCCIATFFNDSTSKVYDPALFGYSLWSGCDVEPVTEECPPSTITLESPWVDPTCNNPDALSQLRIRAMCKRQYFDSFRERFLSVKECQSYTSVLANECKINRFGIYCSDTGLIYHKFTVASLKCADTSTCDPLCLETLNGIVNTVGCCFNEGYNNTNDTKQDWLSYEFWTKCNLKSPGFCKQKFADDEGIILSYS